MSNAAWIPAYIGLGSNLGDPAERVREAYNWLERAPDTRAVVLSPLYHNPPMGPQDQPHYVNAVAGVLTRLMPEALLAELQAIESRMGRVRTPGDKWGPRVIDLDLLLYAAHAQDSPQLCLPHPGIVERNFVLFPLCDIAPGVVVPGHGTVSSLAQRLGAAGLLRIAGSA